MFKRLALLSLLFITHIHAVILESDDIHAILPHVYDTHHHKEILVVFDIDNTIGEAKDGFGGDEWFSAMVKLHTDNGVHIDTAVAHVLPLYFKIMNFIWLEPVQECTPKLIRFLQNVGIATMALTTRSFPTFNRTMEFLAHMEVDFTRSCLSDEDIDLTLRDVAHHRNGVIFSGQNNKGELLVKFFEMIGYHPKKVIFIDDKLKYVKQVADAMESVGIPFVGIRYSHLDEKVANYNLADHEERLQQFCLEHIEPGSLVIN